MRNPYDFSDLGGQVLEEEPSSFDFSDLGGKVIEEPVKTQESPSWYERPLQFGRGIASGMGGLADLANKLVAAPVANLVGGAAELAGLENASKKAYQARDYYGDTHAAEDIEHAIDEPTEGRLKPKDLVGRILNTAGTFATPMPPLKGAKLISGKVGRNLLDAFGASSAVEALPEAGYGPMEDIVKSMIGVKGVNKLLAANKTLTRGLADTIGSAKSFPTDMVAKALSFGAKPNREVLKAATDAGIDLPFNVKLDSGMSHLLANNIFKSIFTSKTYKDVMNNAHKGMVESLEDSLNKIHPEKIGREEGSIRYRQALHKEKERTLEQASKLYDEAADLLSSKDKIVPHNTVDMIKKIGEKIKAPSPSEPMRFVQKRLDALKKKWSPAPSKDLEEYKKTLGPGYYDQIEKEVLKPGKPISLQELIQQKSALMQDIKHGENAAGIKSFIKPLIESIDKDIMASSNKPFLDKWRSANAYYKNDVIDRVRTDVARSVLKNESPKEAIEFMSSKQDIQKLGHILGNIPHKDKIMNGLKRAKFQEIVADSIKNADGTLSYAKLSNFFTKSSARDPLLKELSGDAYKNLQKLSTVAQSYIKSGKAHANPSGTAKSLEDSESLGKILGGVLGASIVGLPNAIGAASIPYMLSKLVSNTKYVDKAVQYALERNPSRSARIKDQMKSIFDKEILAKSSGALLRKKED